MKNKEKFIKIECHKCLGCGIIKHYKNNFESKECDLCYGTGFVKDYYYYENKRRK